MNVKVQGSRSMRRRIQLAEYEDETVKKRGSQNTNADAFGRNGSVGKVKEWTDIPDENTKKQIFL